MRSSSTEPGLQCSGGNSCPSQRRDKIPEHSKMLRTQKSAAARRTGSSGKERANSPRGTKKALWPWSKHKHSNPGKTTPMQQPRGKESPSILTLPCPKGCTEHRTCPWCRIRRIRAVQAGTCKSCGSFGIGVVQSTSTVSRATLWQQRDTQVLSRSNKCASGSGLSCFEEEQLEALT